MCLELYRSIFQNLNVILLLRALLLKQKLITMKKILLSFAFAALGLTAVNAQGKLLIVHNSPDPAVATIDIWVEVPIASQYFKVADDVAYQSGYFYTIPAVPIPGATLNVHVKSSSSTASSDANLFTKNFTTVPTGNNILVANGLITPALVTAKTNPNAVSNAFDLQLFNSGVAFSSTDPNKVAAAIHHGSVDVTGLVVQSFVTTIQLPTRDTLANDIKFKDATAHALVPASPRRLHFIPTGTSQTSPTYKANGNGLSALAGKAAFIVTTGFLDTSSTGTTNSLKVFAYVTDAATTDGAVTPNELPAEKLAGVTEIIHASADPTLSKIQLYVNGVVQFLKLDYLQRFQSTSFIQDFDYAIDIHQDGNPTKTLTVDLNLDAVNAVGVIAGVGNTANFAANPDAKDISAQSYLDKPFVITSAPGTALVNVFHAATDAPTLSVTVPAVGGISIISNLAYGDFQKANVSGDVAIPTVLGNAVVDVKLPGGAIYKSYIVPLGAFDGQGVTLVATGFVDTAANQNGKPFGLYVAIPTTPLGFTTPLKDTVIISSINNPSTSDLQFRMFPNPASSELIMAFDVTETSAVTIDVLDLNGRVVKNVVNNTFNNGTTALTEDISNLANGMYFVRVASENKVSTYKFNVVK